MANLELSNRALEALNQFEEKAYDQTMAALVEIELNPAIGKLVHPMQLLLEPHPPDTLVYRVKIQRSPGEWLFIYYLYSTHENKVSVAQISRAHIL